MTPMVPFWVATTGPGLAQGDYLPRCLIPTFPEGFGQPDAVQEVLVGSGDLIVVTQSCDLENQKSGFVALCAIHTLAQFEQVNPAFAKRGMWEEVRKGRREGLHLVAGPENPANNREALVVDFRQIVSLPHAYLCRHAALLGDRWRFQPPFLEHFSQAFARFFMWVGLPSAIPKYD